MPLYEYVCMECEGRFDRLQGRSEADPACPHCEGTRVRRQLSVFSAGPTTEGGGSQPIGGGCACGGACACGH